MPIVKRRKRTFYDETNVPYEVEIKINLNKNDLFDFEIPDYYIQLFNDVNILHDIRGVKMINFRPVFESMKEFEGILENINYTYKTERRKLIEERVLVIHIQAYAKEGKWNTPEYKKVFRERWGHSTHFGTFVEFEYERAYRVGEALYMVHKDAFDKDCDGWKKLANTIYRPSEQNKSEPTMIIMPYTEGREKFLVAFQKELSNIIFRMDSFVSRFEDKEMLSLMDSFTGENLLEAPKEKLD